MSCFWHKEPCWAALLEANITVLKCQSSFYCIYLFFFFNISFVFLFPRKVALEAERVKRELLQQRMEQEKAVIIEAVCKQGGLYKTAADVDSLLKEHRAFNSKNQTLSVQLRYHKNVLRKSSKMLVKTKLSIQTIRDNFVNYLQTEPGIFDFVPAQLSHPVERVAPSQPSPPSSPLSSQRNSARGNVWPPLMTWGTSLAKSLKPTKMELPLSHLWIKFLKRTCSGGGMKILIECKRRFSFLGT